MSNTPHAGIINSDQVYTLQALADILGCRQCRTVEKALRERGIPIDHWTRGITLVPGYLIRLAVERHAQVAGPQNEDE